METTITTPDRPFLGHGKDRLFDDLARYGYDLIRGFTQRNVAATASVVPGGVRVAEQSRGGIRVFVASDWSVLAVDSSETTDHALHRWESGERMDVSRLAPPSLSQEHEQFDLTDSERSLGTRGSELIRRASRSQTIHMVSREEGIGVLVAEPIKGGMGVLVGFDGGHLFTRSYESPEMSADRYRGGARGQR